MCSQAEEEEEEEEEKISAFNVSPSNPRHNVIQLGTRHNVVPWGMLLGGGWSLCTFCIENDDPSTYYMVLIPLKNDDLSIHKVEVALHSMAELMESLYTKTGNDRFDAAFHRLVAPPVKDGAAGPQ